MATAEMPFFSNPLSLPWSRPRTPPFLLQFSTHQQPPVDAEVVVVAVIGVVSSW
jgi:hypothetical protein